MTMINTNHFSRAKQRLIRDAQAAGYRTRDGHGSVTIWRTKRVGVVVWERGMCSRAGMSLSDTTGLSLADARSLLKLNNA